MMTTWMLKTNDDPLTAARQFLQKIWAQAGLEGMLIPVYQPGNKSTRLMLVENPAQLSGADPFVPLMQVNAGRVAAQLAKERPGARIGVVLRSCEMRALDERVKSDGLNLENWLVIGAECLACFPAQDFEWRVQNAGEVEALTRLVLRNARQGGIALDRFRPACQMCSHPEPAHVDLCFKLLGLPVTELMLVSATSDALAETLHFAQITDGLAPMGLVAQHAEMVKTVEDRRQRAREREVQELPSDLPANLDELVTFLMNCQPCQKCLEACPVHADYLLPALKSGAVTHEIAKRWLVACAECGMCEQACPKGIPLAAVMNRIEREIKAEALAI